MHQSCTTAQLVDVGVSIDNSAHFIPQPVRDLIDAIEEPRLHHHIHHRTSNARGQRVPAVGRAVHPGADSGHRPRGAHKAAKRETAANAFGHRHQVGVGGAVGPLVRKQPPCPANAALHLVKNQQNAEFVAGFTQGNQIAQVCRRNPAFALDRFDEDSGGFLGDRCAQLIEVVKGHVIKAIDPGAKAFQMLGVVARRNGGHRATVKGAVRPNNPVLLRIALQVMIPPRSLDTALQRLCAGIGKEHQIRKRVRGQCFSQVALMRYFIEVRRMPKLRCLILQGRDQRWMRMA